MARPLNARQLTGLDDTHLTTLSDGHRLQREAARAFAALQSDARDAGFDLAIASSFRSFSRQLFIWNAKASGARPVHDDAGRTVDMAQLSPVQRVHAILRYSALPGTSRHHWGTDMDVFDAAAIAPGYQVQLSPEEVAAGGLFDPLHTWLDARMGAGESHGFYRPYQTDRGGVAPERWHLSYAPLAIDCAAQFHGGIVTECWDCAEVTEALLLRDAVEAQLPQLLARYVEVSPDWCPAVGDSGVAPDARR